MHYLKVSNQQYTQNPPTFNILDPPQPAVSPYIAVTLQIRRKKYAIRITLALPVHEWRHHPKSAEAKTSKERSLFHQLSQHVRPDSLCTTNT
jgi:hypothetical protein